MIHTMHLTDSFLPMFSFQLSKESVTSFVKCWKSHRIRGQENLEIPTGVPEHISSFPEQIIWRNQYGDQIEQGSVLRGF